MGNRFNTLTAHTTTIDEFQRALNHMHTVASERIPAATTDPVSPVKRHAPSTSKSGFPLIKLKPSKALDIPVALQDALRNAGVSFNQDSIEALRESLVKTELEREKKLAEHYASATASTHDQLAERLGKADADRQVILDALFAHTPFASAQLVDPKLERKLRKAEQDVLDAEQELMNAETNELSLDDSRVRAFISKYGR